MDTDTKAIRQEETESLEQDDLSRYSPVQEIKFLRQRRRPRLIHPPWHRSTFLASAEYLEFANAGDFAANVWNKLPTPLYARALMAIGGALALFLSVVAIRDGYLSWQNVQLLRLERNYLRALLLKTSINTQSEKDGVELNDNNSRREELLASRLNVNTRELATELIERIAMDALLGTGALLVGAGTILSIWSGQHRVLYITSTLLSGYLGNAFAAVFGLMNAIWSVHIVRRYTKKTRQCRASSIVTPFRMQLQHRFNIIRLHASVSAVVGLLAGTASMLTARWWWGYILLIPSMILQVGCNQFWALRVAYDRPIMDYSIARHGNDNDSEEEEEREGEEVLDGLARIVTMRDSLIGLEKGARFQSLNDALGALEEEGFSDVLNDWLQREMKKETAEAREVVAGFMHQYSGGRSAMEPVTTEDDMQGLSLCRGFLTRGAQEVLICRERYLLEVVSEWVDSVESHV